MQSKLTLYISSLFSVFMILYNIPILGQERNPQELLQGLPQHSLDQKYQSGYRSEDARIDDLFLPPDKNEIDAIRKALPGVEGKDFKVISTWLEGEDWIAENFSYRSNGLLIYGITVHPKAPGKYPVIIENHGGTNGIGVSAQSGAPAGQLGTIWERCIEEGYVVVATSLRGENQHLQEPPKEKSVVTGKLSMPWLFYR